MSDTGRVYQFFTYLLYTIAKENGEGSGEFTFAAVVEKIMPQTGIRGIVVNNNWMKCQVDQDYTYTCAKKVCGDRISKWICKFISAWGDLMVGENYKWEERQNWPRNVSGKKSFFVAHVRLEREIYFIFDMEFRITKILLLGSVENVWYRSCLSIFHLSSLHNCQREWRGKWRVYFRCSCGENHATNGHKRYRRQQ